MAILGKQLTELDSADNLDDGDLLLIRKSGQGRDKSLTKAKLIESIGNSAISGYIAKSKENDKITLKAANQALVPSYYEGMKISFISPISTNGIVNVKIGKLPYIELQKYSSEETVTLIKDEYVEAVYTGGIFKQTNNLNTHLVWSNEYVAEAEINPDETMTVYNLTSAIGVKKTHYYKGMSLLFTVPENSKGIVFVNVDGLGSRKLGESGGSIIAKDVYENHAIMAVYDGKEFRKQKFATIHTKPLVIDTPSADLSSTSKPNITSANSSGSPQDISSASKVEEAPIDIWAEDYAGNPDDPANTISPDAIGSDGKRIFDKTITIGYNGMYQTLDSAISTLINEYGEDGSGHKIAIEIDSSFKFNLTQGVQFNTPHLRVQIRGNTINADLRWITIFVKNNAVLQCNNVCFHISCKFTPIFNFKMHRGIKSNMSLFFCDPSIGVTITFGQNTDINFESDDRTQDLTAYSGHIVAKYGIVIKTCGRILCLSALINKGTFIYVPSYNQAITSYSHSLNLFKVQSHGGTFTMYNSTITVACKRQYMKDHVYNAHTLICLDKYNEAFLKNVTSRERTGKIAALKVLGTCKATLENCNFDSRTEGDSESGCDITVYGDNNELHLKNTTGNTNCPVNKKTQYGIIHRK